MTAPDRVPAPGQVLVDLVAVVVLTAVALLGLDDSYANRSYLVVGLTGVAATCALALLCRVRGWGSGVYLLVLCLTYPLVGASSALHSIDYLGFPSVPALTAVLTATLTAPTEFLTTIPPVDAQGTALVIPHLLGFLFGGVAAWLALRTTRPMWPALPLVAVMVGCIVLGTETSTALLLRASIFAGLVLLWTIVRSGRVVEATYGARGRVLRGVAAAVATIAAVVIVGVLVPPVTGQERVVLRGRVGSGQDVSQLDNPLAAFRRFTRQPAGSADNVAGRRLLRVTGLPASTNLRFVALDTYDGSVWFTGNRTVGDDSGSLFQRIGEQVGVRRPGHRIKVSVEVMKPWTSSWLPLAGELRSISFDYLDGRAQRSDVRYNVATQTGMVAGGLGEKDDYTFTAADPSTRLSPSMQAYGAGVPLQPDGAFLDRYLTPWRKSGLAPMRQVFSLAKYLRANGRYSDGGTVAERRFLPGHGQTRLGRQFFGAPLIVGDDEQFAAFMALAANRLGVPARVVVGSRPDGDGWVRGVNVLAWVELRVADGSWRMLSQNTFMSHKPPKRSDTRQPVSSFLQRASPPKDQPQSIPKPNQPAARPSHPAAQEGTSRLVWLLPLLSLFLASVVPGLKWWRRRRRQAAPRTSGRVVGGWAELLDLARDQSREVPDGISRREQARRLGGGALLAGRADDLVFARDEPSVEQARDFWDEVDVERRRLAAEVGWPRRVGSLWNARSLIRGLSRWLAKRPRPRWHVVRRAHR